MKFTGDNLIDVIEAHQRWIESGGENDDDRADFAGANLRNSAIVGFNLYGANFRGADLSYACLYSSDLSRADLTGASLFEADLQRCRLRGAIGVPFIPQHIPDTGSFIAWKRLARSREAKGNQDEYADSVIAKLLIPEDAKRLNCLDGECRASKAIVLDIQTLDGESIPGGEGWSMRDRKTRYAAGETLEVPDFCEDVFQNHVSGIFFYLDRRKAVGYLCDRDLPDGNAHPLDMDELKDRFPDGVLGTPPQVLEYLIDDDLADLAWALKCLPDQAADVIVLFYYDKLPIERIAKMMEVSIEEAKAVKEKAEKRIAELLKG